MARELKVPTSFIAIDKMSKTIKKMGGNVNQFADKMDKKLTKLERSWGKVGAQAKKLGRSSLFFATALIAPMGLLANEAVKFESSMSNVSTLIDTNIEDMDKMGEQVLELASDLPVPIDELTASLYDIRSAGVVAGDAMSVLEASAQLSVAGLSSVSEATNITTSAINAFASENLKASEITDLLFKTVKFGKTTISELSQSFGSTAPIVQSAGVELKEFMASTAALTTLGTPASVAQNQIKTAISKLQKPTAEMTKLFEKLGVTTGKELIEKEGGMVGAFKAVADAADVMGINLSKAWGSTDALAASLALTGSVNAAYTTTLEDMANGSNAVNEAYQKQLKSGKSQMQLAKNNMQALSITLGKTLIPIITDLVKAVTPALKSFSKWVSNNKSLVTSFFKIAAVVAGVALAVSGISYAVAAFTKIIGVARFALKAYNVVMKLVNSTMLMNPFVLATAAVIGLGYAIYSLTKNTKSLSVAEKVNAELRDSVIDKTADQMVETKLLFHELKRLDVGSAEYNSTLQKLEDMQPGIISKHNLQAGAIKDLAAAEKELTKNILERAAAEAVGEKMRETMKELVTLQMEGPEQGGGVFGQNQDLLDQMHKAQMSGAQQQIDYLAGLQTSLEGGSFSDLFNSGTVPVVNTDSKKEEINTKSQSEKKETVTIRFENLPNGVSVSGTGGNNISMPNVGTTN